MTLAPVRAIGYLRVPEWVKVLCSDANFHKVLLADRIGSRGLDA
jgi:hypothetical protein